MRTRSGVVVLLVVLALALAACSGSSEDSVGAGDSVGVGDSVGAGNSAGAAGEGDDTRVAEAGGAAAEAEAQAEDDDAAPGDVEAGDEWSSALPAAAGTSDHVIREGSMTLEVADDGFDAAFEEVVALARRLGGDVAASETSTTEGGEPSGSLTVRVPVEAYEDLLVGVADIGEVRERTITAQDVTTEFVDLQARRRQLQAQEAFYLGLLDEATTIEDAIRIRSELDGIQSEIERITGRLNLLENRTTFSTLTVRLFETGGPAPVGEPRAVRSLAAYWQTGLDALVAAVGTLLVVALGGLPLVALGVIVLLAIRTLRRRPVDSGGAAAG